MTATKPDIVVGRPCSGGYRTADSKAQIEWKLESKGASKLVFSATGEYDGSSGQCLDSIAKAYPDDDMVQRIYTVWARWHLNDMNAGCSHQRETWDLDAKLVTGITRFEFDTAKAYTAIARKLEKSREFSKKLPPRQRVFGRPPTEAAEKEACRIVSEANGITSDRWRYYIRLKNIPDHVKHNKSWGMQLLKKMKVPDEAIPYIKIRYEEKSASQVAWDEYPGGLLGKPCEVCGYEYGTKWIYEKLPRDVLEEIHSWLKVEAPTEPLHEYAARQFLARHNITMTMERGMKDAPWQTAGHHYIVTLAHPERSAIHFDMWGSAHNKANRVPLDEYSVLSCIQAELSLQDEADIKACELSLDAWKKLLADRIKLKEFFEGVEIEELLELNL